MQKEVKNRLSSLAFEFLSHFPSFISFYAFFHSFYFRFLLFILRFHLFGPLVQWSICFWLVSEAVKIADWIHAYNMQWKENRSNKKERRTTVFFLLCLYFFSFLLFLFLCYSMCDILYSCCRLFAWLAPKWCLADGEMRITAQSTENRNETLQNSTKKGFEFEKQK